MEDYFRWLVIPSRAWKGAQSDTLAVYTMRGSAACGFDFKIGEEYLIYADSASAEDSIAANWLHGTPYPALFTSLCSRTTALSSTRASEDLFALGQPVWTSITR